MQVNGSQNLIGHQIIAFDNQKKFGRKAIVLHRRLPYFSQGSAWNKENVEQLKEHLIKNYGTKNKDAFSFFTRFYADQKLILNYKEQLQNYISNPKFSSKPKFIKPSVQYDESKIFNKLSYVSKLTPDFIFEVVDSSSIKLEKIDIDQCLKYALKLDTTEKDFDLKKSTVFIGEITQQKIDTGGKIIQLQRYLFAAKKQFKDKNIVGVIIVDGDNQQDQLEVISDLIPICLRSQDSLIRQCYDKKRLVIAYCTNNKGFIQSKLHSKAGYAIFQQAKSKEQFLQAAKYMDGQPIPNSYTNKYTEAMQRFNTYSKMIKQKLDEEEKCQIEEKRNLKRSEKQLGPRWGMGSALKQK